MQPTRFTLSRPGIARTYDCGENERTLYNPRGPRIGYDSVVRLWGSFTQN